MQDFKKNIAIITPIKHLGLDELIQSKGKPFYLENGTKEEVRSLFLNNPIDIIICNPNKQDYKIDKELLDGTTISLINTCSTGLSHIDIDYCNKNGIQIYSLTKDYELINDLPSTSELAFGLMLDLLRNITVSQNHVIDGGWDYTQFIGRQIKDLNIGIIGFGRLGKLMFKYCKAFDARVSVYDPYVDGYDNVPLEDFISNCDVLSIHVHLNDETNYMINKNSLKKAKNDLVLINTSRGAIVKEDDIITLINNNLIGAYGADVIENENDDIKKSILIKEMKKNNKILITPHVGGMTIEGQRKAYIWAINKL
jgi:D-3-phosphoglycerate dehydrogenase